MNKIILSMLTLAVIVSCFGCNTIKGIGEDLTAVGGWVTRGSEHVEESVGNNPPGSSMEN